MEGIAVLIAVSQPALDAVADQAQVQIIPGTIAQFSGLATFSDPQSTQFNAVQGDAAGWIALGRPI